MANMSWTVTMLLVFSGADEIRQARADAQSVLAKIKSPCSESRFLDDLANQLNKRITSTVQGTSNLISDMLIIQLVETRQQTQAEQQKLTALKLLAMERLQRGQRGQEGQIKEWQTALTSIRTRQGQLALLTATNFLGAHTATGKATSAAETTITGAAGGSCKATFKASTPADSSCETEIAADKDELDSAPKHLDEFKTLNLLHNDMFAPQELNIQALCKGTVNADPSGITSCNACGDTTTQGQWNNVVGARTVKPTITSAKIDDSVRYTETEGEITCAKQQTPTSKLIVKAAPLAADTAKQQRPSRRRSK
uniref:Variant surface glycoprotein 1735 n=1 Tax=Trypanosoma brucei TaxID=5691 RepID=M4SW58_9TRYP|nr:variant surface glycoprotein 1735 [Trypanosoma brucei]